MIEVEAKVKISSPEKVRGKVREIAKFIGRERKTDEYYTLEEKGKYPLKSLRVRKRKGFKEINFKRRISLSKGVYAKEEFEYKVKDVSWFVSLLGDFGFRKWLVKEKETELWEIKKNFHIEINNVCGLGWFLEVEYLTDKKGIEKARKEVYEVIRKFGFSERDIVKDGYTKLLWMKNH